MGLENMMYQMYTYYSSLDNIAQVDIITQNCFYAVKQNEFWYRGKVTSILDDNLVSVRFVDYGDMTIVSRDDIRPLHDMFQKLPYQAVKARLGGVVPKSGKWTDDDVLLFSQRVMGQHLVSRVGGVREGPEGDITLEILNLVDTTHPEEDSNIVQELVDMGRAVYK